MERESSRNPRAFGKQGFNRSEWTERAVQQVLESDYYFGNTEIGREIFNDIKTRILPNWESAESQARYQAEFRKQEQERVAREMGSEAVERYMEETRPMTAQERRDAIPDWRERVRRRYEPNERVRKEAPPDETGNEAVERFQNERDARTPAERWGKRRLEGESRRMGDEAVERFNESSKKKTQGRKPIADAVSEAWKNRRREPTAEDRYRDNR